MAQFSAACPLPTVTGETVLLAHGGGGKLTHQLIEKLFLPLFASSGMEARHDGAVIQLDAGRLAFSTDSYVVQPLFFPGGNIGDLAVNGTVNDLAMCGARPVCLSAGFILEEGLPVGQLRTVAASMRRAADRAGAALVTGDTKVVDRGKGDGIFINTAGIGLVETDLEIRPSSVASGDAVVVSGDLGAHGVAILSVREGLEFETVIQSDTAPLWESVRALLQAGIEIHCLRDLTRGGLASSLNEIAEAARVGVSIDEAVIPVTDPVRGACEILGLDPLYVANEGRFIAFVPDRDGDRTVELLRGFPVCSSATRIGRVEQAPAGLVMLRSRIGGHRVLDMLSGEQLPRIC